MNKVGIYVLIRNIRNSSMNATEEIAQGNELNHPVQRVQFSNFPKALKCNTVIITHGPTVDIKIFLQSFLCNVHNALG